MKVVLLGNYEPDGQESMQRFTRFLQPALQRRGLDVELVRPAPALGGFGQPHHGLGKWCGYFDKMVLFPWQLRRRISAWRQVGAVVHICDQANAIYAPIVRALPHLVTACDLLAIRCAAGEITGQSTRWSGRHLQQMILRGLNRARRITCISAVTRQDVLRLTTVDAAAVDVTPMGLNYAYAPMEASAARAVLEPLLQSFGTRPYLLHVGGNQWYKNRLGLLHIYQRLVAARPNCPNLVMAGKPFTAEMHEFVRQHHLQARVLSLETVGNEPLRALYATAALFIFPSLEEGFGWPIAEAQACGCPVLTTHKAPMTEVGGDAAHYFDPRNVEAAAQLLGAVLAESQERRAQRVAAGLANVARFDSEAMVDRYCGIYHELERAAVEAAVPPQARSNPAPGHPCTQPGR